MNELYNTLLHKKARGEKTLAVLFDPEKTPIDALPCLCQLIKEGRTDMILVGGSGYHHSTDNFVSTLKHLVPTIPIILFPGSPAQFSPLADALLLLSLISGRNAELLIGQHVANAQRIRQSNIETIPTGYILVDGGKECTTETVSGTRAIAQNDLTQITDTAIAGELLGLRLIYLEAGSGAKTPVKKDIIQKVREAVSVPLIVGGGIRSIQEMHNAFDAGADVVVVGNHFEQQPEDIVCFGQHKCKI